MRAPVLHFAWTLAGALCALLAVTTMGLPGALVLGGGWLLAAGLALSVPSLQGASSWAAATVLEVVVLTGLSATHALLAPAPPSRISSLLTLAAPGVIGAVLASHALVRNRRRRNVAPTGATAIPFTVLLAGLGIARWVSSLGRDYGVAWAMSGDARNEVFIMRSVIHAGGLTPHELRTYPAIVNDVMALISVAGGRAHLRPGDLLLHDAHALATMYVLAGITTALMLLAALIQLLPSTSTLSQLPLGVFIVIFACSVTSASPLVLGTALNGGFVDGYTTLPIVIASIVLTLHFCNKPSPVPLALLGLATIITLFSWSILAFAPGSLALFVAAMLLRRPTRQRIHWKHLFSWTTAAVLGLGGPLLTIGVGVSQMNRLRTEFALPGAIISPQTRLIYVIGILAVGVALAATDKRQRLQMCAALVVSVVGTITIRWINSLPPPGVTWPYYAVKTLWLTASSLLWVAFAPVLIDATTRRPITHSRRWSSEANSVLRAASWSGVVLLVISFTTTATNPLPVVRSGWQQPTAAVVADVVAEANISKSFVFWRWTDPGNERLANFWAALAWDSTPAGTSIPSPPELPGGLALWAYYETDTIPQLCTVVRAVPHITIITTDTLLPVQLESACPDHLARVVETHPSSLT